MHIQLLDSAAVKNERTTQRTKVGLGRTNVLSTCEYTTKTAHTIMSKY
jgi:hypothetical protein